MSITRKLELGTRVLMILAMLGVCWYSWHLSNTISRMNREYRQQYSNAQAGNTEAQELRILVTEKEVARYELDKALEAHPEWAGAPVPDAVADLLRHDSGASREVP